MDLPKWILMTVALTWTVSLWASGMERMAHYSCLTLVAQRYFRINTTVALLTADKRNSPDCLIADKEVIWLLSLQEMFSFVVLKLNDQFCSDFSGTVLKDRRVADYFILVGDDQMIMQSVQTFCFGRLIDDRTHFVVFLESGRNDRNVKEQVETVLATFLKHEFQNVIVLAKGEGEEIGIYSLFLDQGTPVVQIMDKCDGESFRDKMPLFARKSYPNLHGRQVKVGVVITPPNTCFRAGGGYTGLDIEIINAMASVLNFSLHFISTDDLHYPNDTEYGPSGTTPTTPWSFLLQAVAAKKVDIVLGCFILRQERFDSFDYIQPYVRDSVQFFATSDLISSHLMNHWFCLILLPVSLVFICTSLAMHLMRGGSAAKGKSDFGAVLITVWSLLTEQTGNTANLSSKQLFLWALCAFFAVNINAAGKSFLTSVLARPPYIERIRTVQDIIDSDIPFTVASPVGPSIVIFSEEELNKIQSRLTVCLETIPNCLAHLISIPQYGFTAFSRCMKFVGFALPNRLYHPLDRVVNVYDITMYAKKNFILTRKMTTLIHRAAQAGLIDYWYNKMIRTFKSCDLKVPQPDANKTLFQLSFKSSVNALTTAHLNLCFRLLIFGLCLATVVFIFELLSVNKRWLLVWSRLRKNTL